MSLQIRSLILNEDRHAADGNLRDDLACLRAKEEMTRDQQNLGCSQWFPVTSYLDRKTLSDDSLHLSHSTNAAMSDPGFGRVPVEDVDIRRFRPSSPVISRFHQDPAYMKLSDLTGFLAVNRTTIASYFAGMCGVFAGYPLDVLKTKMQTFHFRSLSDCVKDTFNQEGVRGFYRGVIPPILTNSLLKSIAFTAYVKTKRRLENTQLTQNQSLACFISGFIAGSLVAVLSTPLELVKVQMQLQRLNFRGQSDCAGHTNRVWRPFFTNLLAQNGFSPFSAERSLVGLSLNEGNRNHYRNSMDCTRMIWKERGLKRLYCGFYAQVLKESFGFGTYFLAYESLCRLMAPHKSRREAGTLVHFLSGGLSGMAVWMVVFPFDLVKSKLQKDAFREHLRCKGIVDCIKKTYQHGGLISFYRGIQPSLLRAFPVHSMIFVVYEFCLRLLPG